MAEEKILSAYEKTAEQGIDPRCIPKKLEGFVPIDDQIIYPNYPESDQESWRFLFQRQMKYLPGRVCDEYLQGSSKLNFTPDKIPALKDLSAVFKKATGWKIARVPGLIREQDFFELLRQRIFPSTDYIRGKEELDYTPAPDLFHDMFGHMPMLTDPHFASFYRLFGEVAFNAKGIQRKWIETFHWFTVEFGLIKKTEGMRIYGAGIISSLGEIQHALSDEVEVREFNVEKIIKQEYDVWHLQPILFAIESFKQLEDEFKAWTRHEGMLLTD
jgi:phenylalanine-4-hydroxylase